MIAQAYADDQLVIIPRKSVKEIEIKWGQVWKACRSWETQSNSTYNKGKTEATFLEKGGKSIRHPVIRMEQGSQAIDLSPHLKYLGILFDRRVNFNAHARWVRAKTGELANKILNMAKRTYGRKSIFIKKVIDSIVKPAALYGSEIWGAKAANSVNRKQLLAAQRQFLRALVKSYATTPTSALMVIGGESPCG